MEDTFSLLLMLLAALGAAWTFTYALRACDVHLCLGTSDNRMLKLTHVYLSTIHNKCVRLCSKKTIHKIKLRTRFGLQAAVYQALL